MTPDQTYSAQAFAPEVAPAEMSALAQALPQLDSTGRFLEIGTAAGGSLVRLMTLFAPAQRPGFVVVDPMSYFPDQLATVRRNLLEHGIDADSVRFHVATSDQALLEYHDSAPCFAFIFIDGDHAIDGVTIDLQWARLLRVGGLLCLHDYHPNHPGVRLAADRFLRRNRNYERLSLTESLLMLRKTGPSTKLEVTGRDRIAASVLAPVLKLRRSIRKRLGQNS